MLQVVREFEKKINKKFIISYKITNFQETKTICADVSLVKKLLQMDIEKKKLGHFVKDYL